MAANVWLIDGLLTPASAGRIGNFQATKGATGVALPADLKVRALPTPGGAVQILPGGAVIENTFTSASKGQSYMTQLEELEQLEIPATGSGGGTTRLVWQRINDPQYSGSKMGASFHFGSAWPTTYPFVKLAKIVQPASRADIQQDMIEDLREVANPRIWSELRTYSLLAEDTEKLVAKGNDQAVSETWPRQADSTQERIFIPEWATRMKIMMFWSGVLPSGTATSGRLWVQVGGDENPNNVKTQAIKYSVGTERSRQTFLVADMKWIPRELRGLGQKFIPRGNRATGSATQAFLTLDGSTAVAIQVEFMEKAD